jgi:hypothetical protein
LNFSTETRWTLRFHLRFQIKRLESSPPR